MIAACGSHVELFRPGPELFGIWTALTVPVLIAGLGLRSICLVHAQTLPGIHAGGRVQDLGLRF